MDKVRDLVKCRFPFRKQPDCGRGVPDMPHPLCNMQRDRYSCLLCALSHTGRVIQEDLITAHLEKERG